MRLAGFNAFFQRLALGVVTVFVATCQPAPEREVTVADAGDDHDVLAAVRGAWIAAYNAGDAATLAGYFADDAVMLPPDGPPLNGKTAIETYLTQLLEGSSTIIEIVSSTVRWTGNLAVERATYAATDDASPDAARRTGKYVMVFQRDPDGAWKIVWDIWNGNEPTPANIP